MDRRIPDGSGPVVRRLEGELRLVREAVEMVASHGSSRVVVAGLQFGEQILEPARRLASDAGVRVVPMWSTDEAGLDIAIEAPDR